MLKQDYNKLLYQVSNVVGSAYAPTDESNEDKVQQNDDKEKVNEDERSNMSGKMSNFNKTKNFDLQQNRGYQWRRMRRVQLCNGRMI